MGQTAKFFVPAFLAAALFSDHPSYAQAAPPVAPAQAPPAAAEPESPTGGEPMDAAVPPQLDPDALLKAKDPMLTPVEPPANTIASWGEVLRLVRQRSTALHIAAAQTEQASATERRTLAPTLPKLTVGGSASRVLASRITGRPAGSVLLPDTTFAGASADLSQTLFDLGTWYSIGTAKERTRVAELTEQDTRRTLLSSAAQAAVGVITASRVAESNRVSLASDLSTLDLTKRRAELGAATAVDVLRAAQEVATARAQLVTGDETLRQAREALGATLGFTKGWGVANDLRVEDLLRTTGSVCKSIDNLDARADVLSAKRNVYAAERDRHGVDYLYVPTVSLNSHFGYSNTLVPLPGGDVMQWSVGGQLAWTLYDGGDRYGLRRFNTAAETIAREQLTQKRRDATLQLTQADRAILVAEANLEVSTSARDIAKESARLSRLAFINGNGTSFDLVDSARRLREAEIDLLIKQSDVFQARLTAFLSRANCTI